MKLASIRTRDLAVSYVAHQDVPERVFGVSGHACPPLAPHELAPFESTQRRLNLLLVRAAQRRENTGPKHLADDRRLLNQAFLLRTERVEPRGDDSLHSVRYD